MNTPEIEKRRLELEAMPLEVFDAVWRLAMGIIPGEEPEYFALMDRKIADVLKKEFPND